MGSGRSKGRVVGDNNEDMGNKSRKQTCCNMEKQSSGVECKTPSCSQMQT